MKLVKDSMCSCVLDVVTYAGLSGDTDCLFRTGGLRLRQE